MLSRVADNLYWFSRYIRRAENTARLVGVGSMLQLDLPRSVRFSWRPMIDTVGSGALWRGTAGACGGAAPTLERSRDGGDTWNDVTPRYLGIGQLLSVEAFAGSEAQIVARMGDDCELQALRTFTQGRFWESHPEALAASTYVDPADPTKVVIADADVTAPCATPWGARTDGVPAPATSPSSW